MGYKYYEFGDTALARKKDPEMPMFDAWNKRSKSWEPSNKLVKFYETSAMLDESDVEDYKKNPEFAGAFDDGDSKVHERLKAAMSKTTG